jgi:cellulose biosynthesis protein BcsQ
MKTIVVANQKGGSGKSTVTVHLAVAAEQAGDGPIILSDTDPQGTAGDWFNQRKKGDYSIFAGFWYGSRVAFILTQVAPYRVPRD